MRTEARFDREFGKLTTRKAGCLRVHANRIGKVALLPAARYLSGGSSGRRYLTAHCPHQGGQLCPISIYFIFLE